MPKDKKTTTEHILDALMSGKTLLLSDITKLVSKSISKEIRTQYIGSLLTRLSNPGLWRIQLR